MEWGKHAKIISPEEVLSAMWENEKKKKEWSFKVFASETRNYVFY